MSSYHSEHKIFDKLHGNQLKQNIGSLNQVIKSVLNQKTTPRMPNVSTCRDRQASNTRNNLLKYSLALGKTGKTTVKANAATYLKYFTLNLDLVAKTKLLLLKMARIFWLKDIIFAATIYGT